MILGFLGDIHGHYEELSKILVDHPEVAFWYQVGDLGGEKLEYPVLPDNFFFIQGNHENWGILRDPSHPIQKNYLENAKYHTAEYVGKQGEQKTIRTMAFGGNYSPRFYQTPRKDLPQDRQRHFVYEDYINVGLHSFFPDILVTHEAASPYVHRNRDCGQPVISDLLELAMPRLHVFGHHHKYTTQKRVVERGTGEILSVGLMYGTTGMVTYDTDTDIMCPIFF